VHDSRTLEHFERDDPCAAALIAQAMSVEHGLNSHRHDVNKKLFHSFALWMGHHLVQAVNFGGKPVDPGVPDETGRFGGGPANRRAEIWMTLRAALEDRMSLPDSDSLQADLTSVATSSIPLGAWCSNPNRT